MMQYLCTYILPYPLSLFKRVAEIIFAFVICLFSKTWWHLNFMSYRGYSFAWWQVRILNFPPWWWWRRCVTQVVILNFPPFDLICLPNIFFLLPMYVFILHLIYFNVILIDVVKMYYHLNFPAFSWPEDSMAHPSSSVLYIIASSYGIYRSIFLGQNQHVYT